MTNTAELALVEKISGRQGLSLMTFITKGTCFLAIIVLPGYHSGALRGVPVGGVGEKRSFEP